MNNSNLQYVYDDYTYSPQGEVDFFNVENLKSESKCTAYLYGKSNAFNSEFARLEKDTSLIGWQRNIQPDDRNMMSITDGNRDDTIYYLYDESGSRTNKYVSGKSEVITFSDYYSMMFNNSNKYTGGQIQKSIMLGNTRLISRIDQREAATKDWKDHRTFYYLCDHLGSATLITNNKGDIYQSTEYTPYGERWMERTTQTTDYYLPYRFTGKPLDEETGYYYFGARYYDAQRSVWMTSDPAIEKFMEGSDENQGVYNHFNLNSYHYGNNNPIKYTDPDGREPVSIIISIGAFVVAPLVVTAFGVHNYNNSSSKWTLGNPFNSIGNKMVAPFTPTAAALPTEFTQEDTKENTSAISLAMDKTDESNSGQIVYRVYGGNSFKDGRSWTPIDPRTVDNYRDRAGLPPENKCERLVIGKTTKKALYKIMPAQRQLAIIEAD